MFKHSVAIRWSDEDEGFIAFVPELEGLSAFGESREEAVQELMVAAEAYLESLNEREEAIPAPEKIQPYSGQLRLRMPKWLHGKLAIEAQSQGVSLNSHITALLANRQGEHETVNTFIKNCIEAVQNVFQQVPYSYGGKESYSKYVSSASPKGVSELYEIMSEGITEGGYVQ